jgi:hypothetical protein
VKSVRIAQDDYEIIPPEANAASKAIVDMWKILGRPQDPFSESGAKMMDLIIAVWEDLYPKDRQEWYAARSLYQNSEKTISEQVSHHTGRSLASYPYPIYTLMHSIFRNFDPTERDNCMKMVKKWPMFRMANKV